MANVWDTIRRYTIGNDDSRRKASIGGRSDQVRRATAPGIFGGGLPGGGSSPLPTPGSFPMSGQGAGDYLYGSGNLADPNREMMGIETVPNYMQIFNDMLASMTPPRPGGPQFSSAPYEQAISRIGEQGQIGQQAIQASGQDLMSRLGELRSGYDQQAQQAMAAMQQGQQGVNQNIAGALAPINADLAAQGVSAQVGGGARAAALQQQQGAQLNRANVGANATRTALQSTQDTGQAAQEAAGQLLQRNMDTAAADVGNDWLKAETAAQNDYISALNAWQRGQQGAAKQVLSLMSSTLAPEEQEDINEWIHQEGPTADAMAEYITQIEVQGVSPVSIIGDLNKKVETEDGRTVSGWTLLSEKGLDTEGMKSWLRAKSKPKKSSTPKNAPILNQLMGGQ